MKQIVILLLIAISSTQLAAQRDGAMALSLDQAIAYALETKSEAKNAELDIQKAKARNWEIKTTGLPTITGNVDYKYFFKRPTSPALEKIFADPNSVSNQINSVLAQNFPSINTLLLNAAKKSGESISFVLPNDLQIGVQLQQLIFDGRYLLGLKATKELMKTSVLTKNLTEQEIRYKVKTAYYQAQAAAMSMGYLNETYKVVSKLVNDTRQVYKAGFAEELDVNRLELIQASLESQIQNQSRMAEIALANLKFQIGMFVKDPLFLTESLEDLRGKAGMPATTFNIEQRTEYDLLKTGLILGDLDARSRQAAYYPSIFGFVSYAGQSQTEKFKEIFQKNSLGKNNWFQTGVVGLGMKIPIFDSGLTNAKTKQGKLDLQKTRNDLENFERAAALQFQVSNTNFVSSLADEQIAKKTLVLSEKIYKTTTVKFKEGVGSSFELVQSEQDLIQNQLKQIQTTLNVLTHKADLDKAMGTK